MKKLTALVALLILIAGCAGFQGDPDAAADWTPVVDIRHEQQGAYPIDLRECRALGNKVRRMPQDVEKSAVLGGLAVGAIGAALGNHSDLARGAVVGAMLGALAAAGPDDDEITATRRCLIGRGYSVLN